MRAQAEEQVLGRGGTFAAGGLDEATQALHEGVLADAGIAGFEMELDGYALRGGKLTVQIKLKLLTTTITIHQITLLQDTGSRGEVFHQVGDCWVRHQRGHEALGGGRARGGTRRRARE